MKDMTLNRDQSGLPRRQLLGLATLITAGLVAALRPLPHSTGVCGTLDKLEVFDESKTE